MAPEDFKAFLEIFFFGSWIVVIYLLYAAARFLIKKSKA
jgi:hypothetical protein